MKKSYLSLAALVMTFALVGCGETGTSSSKPADTSSKTSEKADDNTSTKTSEASKTSSASKTSEKTSEVAFHDQTFTGAAYDRTDFVEGNITIMIGSTDFSGNNEKVSLTYSVTVLNTSDHSLDFTLNDVTFVSNTGSDFTSKCTTKFGGKFLTDNPTVTIKSNGSASIHFDCSFNDENRDSDTAYMNKFVLKDSDNNTYNVTTGTEEAIAYAEWETIEINTNSEYTADNGFKYVTEGSGAYSEDNYSYVSTETISITNTGSDASVLFCFSSVSLISVTDPTETYTSFITPELDGESFHEFYDTVTFSSNSVMKIDLSDMYFSWFSQSDLPLKFVFSLKDATFGKNYKITYYLTAVTPVA